MIETAITIIGISIITIFILYPLWMIRPFQYGDAVRKARKKRKNGNFSAHVVRKWYGWVVETEKK